MTQITSSSYYAESDCSVVEFNATINATRNNHPTPNHATTVEKDIPLYDWPALQLFMKDASKKRALLAEWATVFRDGAGILVLRQA